jgi:trimeric autotransporter adhesin
VVASFALLLLLLGLPALGFSQTQFQVPFTYQIGGPIPASVQYDVFSANPLALTLTLDGATWVSASLSSNTTPSVLTISVNPTGLAVGEYTSTIQVNSSQGSLVFGVTLDVTAAAGVLTLSSSGFTFNVVAGGAAPASQTLTVTAPSSTSATAQASEQTCTNSTWLTLTPTGTFTAGPSNTSFTVSINPSGLAAGTTCSGTISMTAASVTQTASVTLNVTSSTTTGLTLSSSAFAFNVVAGGAAPASQTLTVTAGSNTSATAQVSEQSCTTSTWLTISPTGNFTASPSNTNFTISVNPTGLTAGTTCTGTISMTAASVTQTASVTLNVSGSTSLGITLSTSALTFTAVAGGAAPPSLTLTVTAGTNTSATAVVLRQSCTNSSWLTVTPTGDFVAGPTSTTFTASVNQSGMSVGTRCNATLSINSAASTLTVPITLLVISVPASVLTVSPAALTFTAVAGGAAPAAQTLMVTAVFDTSTTAQVTEQSCANSSWLTISPTGAFTAGATDTTVTVSANPSGIAAGTTCGGTVFIVAASGVRMVPVTLTVTTPAPVLLAFNVSDFSFYTDAGGAAPASQTLTVTAQTNTSATAQASKQSCTASNWLTLTPTGAFTAGPAGANFAVSVNPSGFGAGAICAGTITIVSAAGTQTLSVTMVLNTPTVSSPVISGTPTILSFNYAAGGSSPAPQIVAVSGAGAEGTFSVAASNTWLQVSPACTTAAPCTTPNAGTLNLSVAVDPTGLNAGATYYGTLVISGVGQATGSTNVNVSFTVTAPLPVIALVANAASFAPGSVSPGEMISIFANPSNPIGPANSVSLSGTTCAAPCTILPTTLGGAQVIFRPGGFAAPLTYVSGTQINCLVPYEILGTASVQVEVNYLGQKSNPVTLTYASTQPGIFTALGTGTGLASVQQYDAQGNYQGQNSSSNPAEAGWYLTFYVTGEGIIPSPAVTGKVTTTASVVPMLGPPNVLMDNLPSTVTYFAEAAGFVSGLMQVNAIVPDGVHTGQTVPLSLSMSGNSSQSGVVIYIK